MHVGIIMDGNGRWATEQGLPRTRGHEAAASQLATIMRGAKEFGVTTLTLYAFAKKNWKREQAEVDFLWYLFDRLIHEHAKELVAEGARFICIGDRAGIPEQARTDMEALEAESKANTEYTLQVALNYDGEDEVVRAVRTLSEVVATGERAPSDITVADVKAALDTKHTPDPDVLIRTGMDDNRTAPEGYAVWRGSSFLQLQSAQSVCVSCTVRWPDFTVEHLRTALAVANPDARLFGGQRA